MEKTTLLISFLVFNLTIFAQSDKMGSFTDSRDGQVYNYIKIGKQVWMAENLNYNPGSGSWCYDEDSSNCKTYGRLYDWETAISVCPAGWHLPSKREFKILLRNYSGESREAHDALIKDGVSGFNAILGGWRSHNGHFMSKDGYDHFWSSSEYDAFGVWYLDVSSLHRYSAMGILNKFFGFSVRCVRD
jgi:uncharacterized protein (TIGR02145 family)